MKKLFLYFLTNNWYYKWIIGSGGGMVVVPLFESKLEPHKAHATSIAIILPLSIISTVLYLKSGSFELLSALKFIPGGIAGALLGCLFP